MKKYIILFIVILAAIGCKKDNNGVTPNGINMQMLYGTWHLQTVTTYSYTNGQLSNTNSQNGGDILIISQGGHASISSNSAARTNITYSVEGNVITYFFADQSGNYTSVQTITELTSNELKTTRGSIASGIVIDNLYVK